MLVSAEFFQDHITHCSGCDKCQPPGETMTEQVIFKPTETTNPIISNVTLIKKYFEMGGRKVEMAEMKALTAEDREELGKLAREALAKLGQ